MKISDFELYRDLLLRHSGLSLTQEKSYLLDSRLTPVARKWGYPTLEALTLTLRGVPDHLLVNDIVEAMMNTETSFFRDAAVFRDLQNSILPYFIKLRGRKKDLRIWSAGCASGQEPYSVAITLKNMESQLRGWGVDILATDIADECLRHARAANYSQFEVQRGLPVQHLISRFEEMDKSWRLNPDIADLVTFEHFNLLDPMDELGLFDMILCRNVLGAFEPAMRATIVNRMVDQLDEGGIILLGEGESLSGLDCALSAIPGLPGFFGHSAGKYQIESKHQAIA